VKFERRLAGNDLHVGAARVQQSGHITRRGSAAKHDNVSVSKWLEVAVVETMRNILRRQFRQTGGYMREVGNPNSQHNAPRRKRFAGVQAKDESAGHSIDAHNLFILQLRHLPFSERESVRGERVKRYWDPKIVILDPPLRAKVL
jgi:hypothetical protein